MSIANYITTQDQLLLGFFPLIVSMVMVSSLTGAFNLWIMDSGKSPGLDKEKQLTKDEIRPT